MTNEQKEEITFISAKGGGLKLPPQRCISCTKIINNPEKSIIGKGYSPNTSGIFCSEICFEKGGHIWNTLNDVELKNVFQKEG